MQSCDSRGGADFETSKSVKYLQSREYLFFGGGGVSIVTLNSC